MDLAIDLHGGARDLQHASRPGLDAARHLHGLGVRRQTRRDRRRLLLHAADVRPRRALFVHLLRLSGASGGRSRLLRDQSRRDRPDRRRLLLDGPSAFAEGRTDYELEVGPDTWNVDFLLVALLVSATVVVAVFNPNPVVAFIVAGVVAVAVYRSDWIRSNLRTASIWAAIGAVAGVAFTFRNRFLDVLGPSARRTLEASPLWGYALALWANEWVKLFLFMIYTGSFIYGGLVLIPFIELYVVREFGWLTG